MPDRCTSCGAPIVWARTELGRRIPVDAKPVVHGNVALLGPEHLLRAVYHPNGTHVVHFATCPDAERWRKR